MSSHTVQLGGAADHDLVGGKASGLGALIGHGFPVPPGFVVTTAAYRDAVTAAGLSRLPPEAAHQRIAQMEMDAGLADEIRAAYAALGRPAVAVRSSGTSEDLADLSFAGQHDTYLGIKGEDALIAAVRDCWASLWTPRAVSYRERSGHADDDLALAVVVQQMVDAETAGVMFTADPVTGDRRHMLVESVEGLGESLVSGEETGERRTIGKRTLRQLDGAPALPRQRSLARLGRAVERAFGSPQDIEWAYTSRGYQLVQSRPLTALPPGPTSTSRRRGRGPDWQMALDHMPYPPFPIDQDLLVRPVLEAILRALRSAGLTPSRPEDVLTEIDDGVVQIRPPALRPQGRAVLGVPRAMPAVLRNLCAPVAGYRDWVTAELQPLVERIDREDPGRFEDSDLLRRMDMLLSALGGRLFRRFALLPRGVIAEALALRGLRGIIGPEEARRLLDDLLTAVPCVTTRSNAALAELAATIRRSPALRMIYRESSTSEVPSRLRASEEGRELAARIEEFLASYGFREMSIFSLGVAPLRERADVVHAMLAGLIADHPESQDPEPEERAAAARAELHRLGTPTARLLRGPILALVDVSRSTIAFREDSHFQLVMVLAVARRMLLELGRRATARGGLDSAEDVAYLRKDELDLPPQEMRALVEHRRAARERSLDGYTIIAAELVRRRGREDAVVGATASRGIAVGTVRIIRGEEDFATLRRGEIMVCPYTNPTWTPLFDLAAAVVVDTGGVASHAAIVARERGIPAVMGTGNGTTALSDGQRVVVDAHEGSVSPVTTTSGEESGAISPTREDAIG